MKVWIYRERTIFTVIVMMKGQVVLMIDNNIYVNVYFRIEAGYRGGTGMNKEQTLAFFEECKALLNKSGFIVTNATLSGDCPEAFRGSEYLYCHPQSLSGYIIKGNIPEIEKAIGNANTFKHYKTDMYDEALNYTEDEFRDALKLCRPKLEHDILCACITKRKNLFRVFDCFSMNGLSSELKVFRHSRLKGIEINYIFTLLYITE